MLKRPRAGLFSATGLRRLARRAARVVGSSWAPELKLPRSAPHNRCRAEPIAHLSSGLHEVSAFGANPGRLRMLLFTPPAPPSPGAPLIVVLHGCQQDPASFAEHAGWMDAARRLGCALVLPVQTRANNQGTCFNWFRREDTQRDSGEAMSIRQMIRFAQKRLGADRKRVFVVGLSAGGAMAAALLAAYPAVFAAGAVVAGMPVGSAASAAVAMLRMRQADAYRTPEGWAEAVRGLSATAPTSWPRLSIWQGLADRVVAPRNAVNLAAQWAGLHGYTPETGEGTTPVHGVQRRVWGGAGRPAVELWTLADAEHGFPVEPTREGAGRPGPFVLRAPVSATHEILRFWGLET